MDDYTLDPFRLRLLAGDWDGQAAILHAATATVADAPVEAFSEPLQEVAPPFVDAWVETLRRTETLAGAYADAVRGCLAGGCRTDAEVQATFSRLEGLGRGS